MFYIPYNKNLKERARLLRKNATPEENKLWYQFLSTHKERFLRQKVIDNYIVDFYCPVKRLVIEIDGSQHYTEENLKYDEKRSKRLQKYGIEVIRITNYEINRKFYEVCEYLEHIIKNR